MNSINWARIAAQVPYYVAAALALGAPDREMAFSVPTGNFGNVLAAWVARRMGLPVARLIVGSNRNDILARFLASNDMSIATVEPSLSPSMDIQVSSNFERLLFELLERDRGRHGRPRWRSFAAPERCRCRMAPGIAAARCSTASAWTTPAPKPRSHGCTRSTGYLADPHTAIGVAAARANPAGHGVPIVTMATAHPAKFPDVDRARHRRPSATAAAARRSVRAAGAFHCAAQRPCRRRDAGARAGATQRMMILDAAQTAAALPFDRLIPALRDAFITGATVPLRHRHDMPQPDGTTAAAAG